MTAPVLSSPGAAGEASSAPVRSIVVAAGDDVAVALADLDAGAVECGVVLAGPVARGHKFALRAIAEGETVRKLGAPIGRATAAIAAGGHVHTHNLETQLSGHETYAYVPAAPRPAAASAPPGFDGYLRGDGRVGVRNEIWVIATVGCVAQVCQEIAREAHARHAGDVDGVYAVTHPFGCSQLGDDLSGTRAILAALAAHPNAGGVLVVGLGCESNQIDALLAAAPQLDRTRIRALRSQAVADELGEGLALVGELVAIARNDARTPRPFSDLVVGLKCGGSDGFSGLTANPLLGRFSDTLTDAGGTVILTEIPEAFGAERLLMARAADEQVFDALVGAVNGFKDYFTAHNQPIYENPSPGNKEGGITTLEEKSLGAVQKAGGAIVTDVIPYGGQVRRPGLTVLEAPGNDAVSSTALAAAGATLILFTTGRGTPLGFPAPTLKVASNTPLATRKARWIDFNAGRLLDGETREQVDADFLACIRDTASGRPTRSELNGERAIAIWKRGVTL